MCSTKGLNPLERVNFNYECEEWVVGLGCIVCEKGTVLGGCTNRKANLIFISYKTT